MLTRKNIYGVVNHKHFKHFHRITKSKFRPIWISSAFRKTNYISNLEDIYDDEIQCEIQYDFTCGTVLFIVCGGIVIYVKIKVHRFGFG